MVMPVDTKGWLRWATFPRQPMDAEWTNISMKKYVDEFHKEVASGV